MVYDMRRPGLTPAAADLAEQWQALGEPLDADDAEDLARRIERDKIAELYRQALGYGLAVKHHREARREVRRKIAKTRLDLQ